MCAQLILHHAPATFVLFCQKVRNSFHHKYLELENHSKTNFRWVQSALQERRLEPQRDATEIIPGTGACWRKRDPRKATTYILGAYSSFAAPASERTANRFTQATKSMSTVAVPMPVTNCSGEGAWTAWQTCHSPRPPSCTSPSLSPSPSPLTSSVWLRWEQPGLSAQVTPVWVGCRRPARPARPCGGLPAARPPAGLRRPTLLLAGPKGGSGVLGGERGSAALQGFAFLRHLVGVWELSFSSLSLRGMSVCRERGRV